MLFEVYIWSISFLMLYVAIFWLVVSGREERLVLKSHPKVYPVVSLAVPAYNEEKGILKTLKSLSKLDYPHEKLEVLIVDDASKDGTVLLVKNFIKQYSGEISFTLFRQKENKGKAAALNRALAKAKGKYFAVLDADSMVSPSCVRSMVPLFEGKVAAVISTISVYQPRTLVEKIQRFEYIMASFMRRLMSAVGTLHTTPGVLSLYKTSVVRSLKGFDEHNLTEDYEIAMRLKYHHYEVRMCELSVTYTSVPENLSILWKQRVRWFRGFIHNNLMYRKMFMSKKHGLMGMFQMPLNIFMLGVIFVSLGLLLYQAYVYALRFFYRILIMRSTFFDYLILPGFKDLLLGFNFKLYFPFFLLLSAGIFLYVKAHRFSSEKWRFHFATFIYLFLYPLVRSLQWLHALVLELAGARRTW